MFTSVALVLNHLPFGGVELLLGDALELNGDDVGVVAGVVGKAPDDVAALADVALPVGKLQDVDPAPGFPGGEVNTEAGAGGDRPPTECA